MLTFLRKIFSPPPFGNEDIQRSARYLNTITLAAIFLLLVLMISRTQTDLWIFGITDFILLGLIVVMVVAQIIMRLGYVNDASYLLIAIAWAGMTYQAFNADGIRDVSILAYIALILIASLLLSWRTAVATTLFSVAAIWAFAILEENKILETSLDTPINLARDMTVVFTLVAVLIYLLISSLSNSLKDARTKTLELSNANLELQALQTELEQRVNERTKALERRARQLQATASVGNAASTIRNIEQLINRVTRLITERFGFYHVGIFLLDERNEYAVLQGSNSTGGKRMLERGHRLKVGEVGIVGSVAASRTARISLDVGEDAVFFDNPDLPDTRSEMALPLLAGGIILGVLDVQSIEPNAFAEDDIATLQILADQIAVSIQNALFLEQTQEALEATRRAYEEQSRQAWQQFFGLEREVGYLSAGDKIVKVSQVLDPDIARALTSGKVEVGPDGRTIGVPVQSRNQIIGAIRLQKPTTAGDWSENEILDAQNLANQLSLALESARLYEESRQRAEREAAIADITSKIGADPSMEAILQTTIRELGQTLGDTQVLIQLKPGSVITE